MYIVVSIVSVNLFTACKNSEQSDVAVVTDEKIEKVLNFSEIDFVKAMTDYNAGKYNQAAKHFNAAIEDLKAESADLPKEAKEQVSRSLQTLDSLEQEIKLGKITNIQELDKAFLEAETSLAHDYFFVSSIYAIGQPKKSRKALNKAVNRMEYASKKLTGKTKEEAMELLKKGKDLQAKHSELAEEWAADAKNLVNQISEWRKEHRSELFYTTGPYYPYMYL